MFRMSSSSSDGFLSYEYLEQFLGVSRLSLWPCPHCVPSVLPASVAASPDYSWGVVLCCGLCNCSWVVCHECSNTRTHFITSADCLRHHRHKHRNAISKVEAQPVQPTACEGICASLEDGLAVAAARSPQLGASLQHKAGALTLTPVAVMYSDVLLGSSRGDVSDSSTVHGHELLPTDSRGSSVSNVVAIPSNYEIFMGDRNAHKFILIDVPVNILEAIYAAVSVLPLTQFEVICGALKQLRFFNACHLLFLDGNCLWDELLGMLQKSFFHSHSHLNVNEINATVLVTDGCMVTPQQPHIDYSWESILLPSRRDMRQNRSKFLRASCQIPFTGHMPVSSDGSYIYLWPGPGVGVLFHIPYGKMLVIRGDVVHCGGFAPSTPNKKLYYRVHFYFPTDAVDIPPNAIYWNNYDGQAFSRDYIFPCNVE
jgi:hypothetical protein